MLIKIVVPDIHGKAMLAVSLPNDKQTKKRHSGKIFLEGPRHAKQHDISEKHSCSSFEQKQIGGKNLLKQQQQN